MAKRRSIPSSESDHQRALLAALSDDLALPLMQIKTSLELAGKADLKAAKHQALRESMLLSVDAGLQLIEAYKLALKVHDDATLPMEPVSVGAVLTDVAQQLSDYGRQYDTVIEVNVQGRLTPVLANRQTLVAAMQTLGASLIRAQAAAHRKKQHRLMLGAHRTEQNVITAGVFGSVQGISDLALRNARALAGRARQPLTALPPGAASGVLIADVLCAAMWQPLRAAAHSNLHGLATTVPVSKQLHLI